jgi:hypothetical protein
MISFESGPHSVTAGALTFTELEIGHAQKLQERLRDDGIKCQLLLPPPKGSRKRVQAYMSVLRMGGSGAEFTLEIEKHRTLNRLIFKMNEIIAINRRKGAELAAAMKRITKRSGIADNGEAEDLEESFFHICFQTKPEVNLRVEDKTVRDLLVTGMQCIMYMSSRRP